MSTFKITNITNLLGKRKPKYNTIIEIDYIDGMVKKIMKIKPGDTIFFTSSSLPLSVRRLRLKNLIAVAEISPEELNKRLIGNSSGIVKSNMPGNIIPSKTSNRQIEKKVNTKKEL